MEDILLLLQSARAKQALNQRGQVMSGILTRLEQTLFSGTLWHVQHCVRLDHAVDKCVFRMMPEQGDIMYK